MTYQIHPTQGFTRLTLITTVAFVVLVIFLITTDRKNKPATLPTPVITDTKLLPDKTSDEKPSTENYTGVNSNEDIKNNWSTFSGSDFDIKLKYPKDWEIVTGNTQNGTFDFECEYIKDFLKDASDCTGTTKSPMLVVRPKTGYKGSFTYEGLMLFGPTSGLGGGCPECKLVEENVTINGNTYVIPVKIAPAGSERSTYSTFPDGSVYISETGTKSKWSRMDLELDTNDEATYKTIIEIIQTITPN